MSIRSFVAIGSLLVGLVASEAQAVARPLLDGDADGVRDDRDACPYTPLGITVHPDGCSTPGDEDEDGIADVADACPLSPGGAVVDGQGCALDEDVDGVADGVDRCPLSPMSALVNANGCAPGQSPLPGVARRAPVITVQAAAAPLARAPAASAPPASVPPRSVPAAPVPAQASAAVSRPLPPVPVPVLKRPAAPLATPAPAALPTPPLPALSTPAPAPVAPTPAVSPITVRSEPERTFYFDEGETGLSWAAERAIKQSARDLLPELEKNPAASLVLSGHADTKSDGNSAPRVATARAQAVRGELIAAGVPAQRIVLRVPGVGEPRFFGASLARNCRVELRVSGRQTGSPVVRAASAAPIPAITSPAPTASSAMAAPEVALLPALATAAVPPLVPVAAPAPAREDLPDPPPPSAGNASVMFPPFSAVLDDSAMKSLDAFVQHGTRAMLADVAARVVITSGIGSGETGTAALRLAESRAASVSVYLVALGLPRNRVEVSAASQTGTRRTDVSIIGR